MNWTRIDNGGEERKLYEEPEKLRDPRRAKLRHSGAQGRDSDRVLPPPQHPLPQG